jgi:mannose-6-phosphate isomerase-like protein (cupin superfamily)
MQPVSIDNAEHYSWGDGCDGWHLLKSDDLSVIREKVPPHKGETLHFHRRAEQFFYILRGTAQLVIDGKTIILNAGQGLHIAANVSHRFENPTQDAVEFLVVSSPPSHGDRQNIE